MKITKIPYPRLLLIKYALIAFGIAFSVAFILIFFQPFGTSHFKHPNKNLILAGYGLCVFVTIAIFYFLSLKVFHKNKLNQWSILSEVIDLFLVFILSLAICYIYSVEIFDRTYSFGEMLHFISLAASVAILPVIGCLGYLYVNWKDVVRSSISTTEKDDSHGPTLIIGNNKSDRIKTSNKDVILIMAQNNYVMLYLQKEDRVQRHILRSTLKEIKEQLDKNIFLYSHRSYIINKSRIQNIIGNKSKAELKIDGFEKKIPVSRNNYDLIKNIVTN